MNPFVVLIAAVPVKTPDVSKADSTTDINQYRLPSHSQGYFDYGVPF